MANRYCNLVGSKKISEDFNNINVGFDKVQVEMDSKSSGDHRHPNATDTTDGFMSAQDKAKMDASTAAATPGTLVQRDASGRMKAAAPSAKTDVARKAEVDAVQADLDSHKADAVMHVTAEDHEKLGSIEEGAEVNQPAFSKVNDIEANEKTDALTFKGGVGIKITTNPNTNEVTITSSGESTPGAHGSSHTEHGADPIPNATAQEGGLMSSADKAEFDKLATEVPKQASELMQHDKQLKEHTAELEDHEQRIDGMETGLADVPGIPLELQPGLQVVEMEQDGPFRMGEIKGRTLLNLNGKDGNFDYRGLLPTFFGTGEIIPSSGPISTKAMKVVCNRTDTAHFGARYELNIDRSKHYIAMAYMENVSCDIPAYFSIAEMKDTGYTSLRLSGKIAKGSGMQYLYATIDPAMMDNREKLVYYFRGEGTSGAEFRIGPFAFYEVSQAEYDAIATMTPEQVAEKYPYVESMTNVKNPYAIITGGNLLPPFYFMGPARGAEMVIKSDYEMDLITRSPDQFAGIGSMEANHKTYRIDFDSADTDVKCYFNELTAPSTDPIRQHEIDISGATITIGDDAKYIGVYFGNKSIAGSFKVRRPMLVPGSEPKPFVPQQRSMIAFETELAAHPVDGSNPDTLFMGDDGLPYVLEKWRKRYVGTEGEWLFVGSKPSHKTVGINGYAPDADPSGYEESLYATKYNGQTLIRGTAADLDAGADVIYVYGGGLRISIANTDSGWGPDYNPKQDEIKAFHLGWKMFDTSSSTAPYNRTDGLHKGWVKIYCGVGIDGGIGVQGSETTVLPSVMNDMGYTPYRLQYLKAKPTVEPVRNYELGATLSAGSNMVEVGSGIVIREKVNPPENINASTAGRREINYTAYPSSKLNYRTATIIDIYRSYASDRHWTISNGTQSAPVINSYGLSRANISGMYYDPTAVYHVTYTMLDPMLTAPIRGTIASNLRGTVSDLVQDVGDVQRRLSVVETQKAEKDAQHPEWIKATLLNGWTNTDGKDRPVSYRKVGDAVEIDGTMRASGVTTTTVAFRLPDDYKPSKNSNHLVSKSSTGGSSPYARVFVDAATGEFRIVPEGGAINDWVSLNGITLFTT
ncbi:hypothetical protein ACE3MS_31135 [Paenibacillus dendritiformis]|uniref:hypothetical protein n=1 Tax=Paenibacillus dendritiformis TaxID=130049 RepID=UPI0036592E45